MKDAKDESVPNADQLRTSRKSSDQQIALHLSYGEIGISAVAAAARYQSSTKPAAPTPSRPISDEHAADA